MGIRVILAALLVAPAAAFAVFLPVPGTSFSLSLYPEFPRANQQVIIKAENVSSPASASYVWRVNGRVVDQGIGVTAISADAGRLGSETEVSVTISENGALKGERTIVIRPAEVDIVWEGNTYMPPFYTGRPLVNPSSAVRLLAVPHLVQNGVRVASENVVYTWHVNGGQTPVASGYGRSVINLKPPQFVNEFAVSVTAETRDGLVASEQTITIRPQLPRIMVYERAPLLGVVFEHAVAGEFALQSDEATFMAYPLGIADVDAPEYSWHLNGAAVSGDNPREITFRKQGEGAGVYNVKFSLENPRALFEQAATGFLVRF